MEFHLFLPQLRLSFDRGVVLLADLWAPRVSTASLPTALLRSPYGRRGCVTGSPGALESTVWFRPGN